MRRTALLVAAQSYPYEGPWVPLGRRGGWRFKPEHDFLGGVAIEVIDGSSPLRRISLNAEPVEFIGEKARAIILDGNTLDVLITVNIERID